MGKRLTSETRISDVGIVPTYLLNIFTHLDAILFHVRQRQDGSSAPLREVARWMHRRRG